MGEISFVRNIRFMAAICLASSAAGSLTMPAAGVAPLPAAGGDLALFLIDVQRRLSSASSTIQAKDIQIARRIRGERA